MCMFFLVLLHSSGIIPVLTSFYSDILGLDGEAHPRRLKAICQVVKDKRNIGSIMPGQKKSSKVQSGSLLTFSYPSLDWTGITLVHMLLVFGFGVIAQRLTIWDNGNELHGDAFQRLAGKDIFGVVITLSIVYGVQELGCSHPGASENYFSMEVVLFSHIDCVSQCISSSKNLRDWLIQLKEPITPYTRNKHDQSHKKREMRPSDVF
ncbi:hypothetical protein DL96DRAFT_1557483 [Flagelloscypha sp. PMI_526]|nr:hypothetical protein DL96DRAFT_1557483 [Flagelloscypha sp. PMI_526]